MKLKRIFVTLFAFVLAISSSFIPSVVVSAEDVSSSSTETTDGQATSDVLKDLQSDPSFNVNNYVKTTDLEDPEAYTVRFVQLAESTTNDLILYTYQPSWEDRYFTLVDVRLSNPKNDGETIEVKDYELELLSQDQGFEKWKVQGFEVSSAWVRCYEIVQLSRLVDPDIDDLDGTEEHLLKEAINISQRWKLTTNEDRSVSYEMTKLDTIEVTSQFVFNLFLFNGLFTSSNIWDALDGVLTTSERYSSFIAFSTDWDIDALYEVEVSYRRAFRYGVGSSDSLALFYECFFTEDTQCSSLIGEGLCAIEGAKNIKDLEYQTVVITPKAKSFDADCPFWGTSFEWNTIQTSDEFLSSQNIDDLDMDQSFVNKISSMDYVVNFVDFFATFRVDKWNDKSTVAMYYPKECTIMRLKFLKNGDTYNLPAVAGTVKNSGKVLSPDSNFENFIEYMDQFWDDLLAVLIFVVGIILIAIFAPWIFTILFKVIGWIFKALWWVICLPFRLLGKLFTSIKKKKEDKQKDKDIDTNKE